MNAFLAQLLEWCHSPWEVAGFITGVLSVWFTVREKIWCWPIGIVNVAVYAVVFWQSHLYADMGLQVVYLALSAYGWYEWLHGGKDQGQLEVSNLANRVLILSLSLGALCTVVLARLLRDHTDAALPWLDSGTTAYSLVAQWMLTRKHIENWVVWIAVDVVYVGIYLYKNLYLTAGLYLIFLGLAIAGWRRWRRSMIAASRTA